MLYTRKGDNGTTKIFNCDQRLSKSSIIAEALGSLDETNSFLGIIKARIEDKKKQTIINNIQKNFFIIQAEIAGADKKISRSKILSLEKVIGQVERELPAIKSFFISGATLLSAEFDFARTLIRRAERMVVAVKEEGAVAVSPNTLAYLNRLSSFLYALARQEAHKSGIKESAPDYK